MYAVSFGARDNPVLLLIHFTQSCVKLNHYYHCILSLLSCQISHVYHRLSTAQKGFSVHYMIRLLHNNKSNKHTFLILVISIRRSIMNRLSSVLLLFLKPPYDYILTLELSNGYTTISFHSYQSYSSHYCSYTPHLIVFFVSH